MSSLVRVGYPAVLDQLYFTVYCISLVCSLIFQKNKNKNLVMLTQQSTSLINCTFTPLKEEACKVSLVSCKYILSCGKLGFE